MENPVLRIIETNEGKFYKAWVNGHSIGKSELFDVLECEDDGYRLSKYAEGFKNSHPDWVVDVSEIDVS